MVRRFSWCTAVALVVLLFVTTEGLRERSVQTADHKAANRGTLKYNSKSLEESTTASSTSSLSRSRTNRERSTQSRRLSNIEGTTQASTINSELNSSESSITRTIGTTERDSTSTAIEVADESNGTSDKKVGEVRKIEPTINRRNGKRYLPENDEGTRSKDSEQRVSVETSRGVSRRTSNGRSNNSRVTERLDNKGPSVFLATTELSRSRTGRKIQTTYSKKDSKTQISTSRRYNNKKFEDVEFTTTSYRREGKGRSTTERIERSTRSGRSRVNNTENNSVTRRGPDTLLSESESVRIDIPLVVNGTGNPVTTESVAVSQRRSDTKESSRSGRTGFERSKNRGRSNDPEVAGSSRGSSGTSSRRGSSKFGDSTTTEANEQVVSSRRNTISRDRSRSPDAKKNSATESRSRSRGRNLENNEKSSSNGGPERDAKRKLAGERNSSDRRSRVSDGVSRITESRGKDSQDVRGRSRNRSRPDVVTPVTTDVTTTVAPETTALIDVTTIDSEVTTIRPVTPTTTSSSRVTSRPSSTSTSTTEASGRGRGRGRGRKQKEDFFNFGLGFRGRKPSPEGPSNATQPRKTILWKNDTPINGNPGWTLRRRPGHFNNTANPSRTIVPSSRDQTNEVIPPNEESTSTEVGVTTTTESFTTSSSRRGFKKLQTIDESSTVAGTTAKSYRRGNKTFGNGKATAEREESDNYPPEFKARLTQLKNTNMKIPAPKTTSRTQLEVKKSSAALFAERSRMKLDLARRLVKPELNIEENDLDATTASSFSKPRPTGVPVLDETSKVVEHAKPAATASGRSNRPSTSVESSRDEVNVKSSRKDHEDSSKVIGRPNGLKKGRIIAERMVTSISIEERTATEETTKPYVLSTNPPVIAPAEQGSETAVDSTRIRLSGGRAGKKSKEEDSTIKNMKVSLYSTRRTETNDHVTTIKPKKPYLYQSRNTKFQLQESTPIEQSSTTPSPKKPYAPTHRKSQTSQPQDGVAKKSKFSNSAGKPMFRPRYSKRTKEKSIDEKKTNDEATITTNMPVATSRYSRKKSLVKSIDDRSITTDRPATQTKKLEFRPRTATYRRHSEVPTTLVESSTKVDRRAGVAITPRSTKYHATLKTTTVSPRSVAQEPRVSLKIANESTSGIIDSSNGDIGNSNIFNPTRSTFLSGNNTLLEQLRSTVAPLLSSLGNKTPVFSESYSNVNNANSPPRITPSGQPPRFSARYKGAELFVRKQNNVYQPTVPSITSSSTTPVTPVESNALLNTQMGTASVTPIVSTGRPPTDSQGGRIVQDRERDEATRTKEAGGQRSSVYIGQDKFVNYWTDGASTSNPRVLGVNINSVATAANKGPSPAVPSFENLLNNQPDRRVTAPPGFPWRDPLDQIFGITTSSPVITASVASNTLDDSSEPNGPISARPINPFVEVFTPFSNAIGVPKANIGSIPPPPPPSTPVASSTTPIPTTSTTTTTTMASPPSPITTITTITTTTTTTAPTTTITTTTTTAPTISTITARTTTPESATTAQRANIASQVGTSGTATSSQTNSLDLQKNLLNPQQQNAFGTTFDDLVFLNSLLQSNSRSTTQKTLTQVEQLLANKILELALKNPGPTRSPKAINIENPPPNSIYQSPTKSPTEPIIIELSPSMATSTPTWKSVETQQPTSQKPTISSSTPVQVTWKPVTTTTTKRIETSTVPSSTTIKTTLISTTKAPVTIKAKPATTPRPRTTTQAPLGFAGLLWQTLLGGNIFEPSTTPKPVKVKSVPKPTQKAVNITPKPLQTTERIETTTIPSTATTLKAVDISKIQVSSPNSIINEKSVTTPGPISTTDQPLINNPNPRLPNVVTSTYSPEDDAKFLVELLRAVEHDNKIGSSKKTSGLSRDDEAFLRAILSGRALTTPPALTSTTEASNAALLAALLKAQGIEPSTPANNIREQLQLASLGQSVTSTTTTSPTSESTTITTRPASTAANRPTDTTKKSVTPRPTSGPRTRTTIWSPSSTYPPPLFSSFPVRSTGSNSGNSVLIGATRAFSQFLGAAISGAAQQLQSLVRNGTRIVSEVVG